MAQRKLGSAKATDTLLITAADLTADVSGVLPTANGGTGTGVWTDGQIAVGQTAANTLAKKSIGGDATMDLNGVLTLATVPSSKGGTGLTVLGTALQVLRTNAGATAIEWGTVSGGATALSSLTAATAGNTIANSDNAQVWQWQLTTAGKIAFNFAESTASTATGTAPLVQIDTLAASTAIPLLVKSRGTEVFRVASATAQILGTSGTAAAPIYSFAADTDTGIIRQSEDVLTIVAGGALIGRWIGTAGSIGLSFPGGGSASSLPIRTDAGGDGIFMPAGVVGVAIAGVENARFIGVGLQQSIGSANATSYAINVRKARGSITVPTVITTGDDLLTISGYGYVGATNTYVEAAQILFDSQGTISDSATGVGGQLAFKTRTVGQALVNRVVLNGNVALTTAVAATLITIPLATLQMASGLVIYSIEASDGVDVIAVSGQVSFAAVNKAGVYTTDQNIVTPESSARSDATDILTNTFGFSNGTNQTLFQITPSLGGMTATTFRITYSVVSGAQQNLTAP